MKPTRLLALLGGVFLTLAACGWTSGGTTPSFVSHMKFQNGAYPTPDYAGITDTYIRPGAALADTGKNYGASDSLKLSGPSATTVGENRILMRVDLTGIPDTAQVGRAILWLYQGAPNASLAVPMNDSSAMVVNRSFYAWNEGVGTDGSPTAPPHSGACWNRRKGQLGPKWWLAGAKATPNGNTLVYAWRSGLPVLGDSSAVTTNFFGADSIYNGDALFAANGAKADVPSVAPDRGLLKAGTAAARRLGWVGIDITHQVDLWVRGANENDGLVISLPSWTTQTTQFTFFSSNYVGANNYEKKKRPMAEIWFTNGQTTSGGGVATTTRQGMGLTGSYGPH